MQIMIFPYLYKINHFGLVKSYLTSLFLFNFGFVVHRSLLFSIYILNLKL